MLYDTTRVRDKMMTSAYMAGTRRDGKIRLTRVYAEFVTIWYSSFNYFSSSVQLT